jgi:hypothetical protein
VRKALISTGMVYLQKLIPARQNGEVNTGLTGGDMADKGRATRTSNLDAVTGQRGLGSIAGEHAMRLVQSYEVLDVLGDAHAAVRSRQLKTLRYEIARRTLTNEKSRAKSHANLLTPPRRGLPVGPRRESRKLSQEQSHVVGYGSF